MKPVLLLTDSNVFAGTERHILDLAQGLREAGAEAWVGCPAGTQLASQCSNAGLRLVPVEKRGRVDLDAAKVVARLLRRYEIGFVHAHNGRTALVAAMARRLAGHGAAVMTQHFIHPDHTGRSGFQAKFVRKAHLWVGRELHGVVAISDAVAAALLERGDTVAEKVSVIPNGIREPDASAMKSPGAVRVELQLDPDAPLIVCVARLEPEKDVSTLIAAMTEVVRRQPKAVCVIAGSGSLHDRLDREVREAGLDRKCRLLGFRTDATTLIHAADVFVLPSRAEPAGLVLLEAMALGKPVVAANAGGPREIVLHDRTGLLFTPGCARELGEALSTLLADPAHAAMMGAQGRSRYASHYTAKRMCADTLDLYRSL